MAHKTYSVRFPLRKLNRKSDFKREKLSHQVRIPRPREAGRRQGGISRRNRG